MEEVARFFDPWGAAAAQQQAVPQGEAVGARHFPPAWLTLALPEISTDTVTALWRAFASNRRRLTSVMLRSDRRPHRVVSVRHCLLVLLCSRTSGTLQ